MLILMSNCFVVNGETRYSWDHPSVVGIQQEDSEGMYYAGPMFGSTYFITTTHIMAGDFIRGGAAFLLISFEGKLSPCLYTV